MVGVNPVRPGLLLLVLATLHYLGGVNTCRARDKSDEVKKLLKERRDVLSQAVDRMKAIYFAGLRGTVSLKDLMRADRESLHADLDWYEKSEERVQAIEKHLKAATMFVRHAEVGTMAGRFDQSFLLQTKAYLLEVQAALLKEKKKQPAKPGPPTKQPTPRLPVPANPKKSPIAIEVSEVTLYVSDDEMKSAVKEINLGHGKQGVPFKPPEGIGYDLSRFLGNTAEVEVSLSVKNHGTESLVISGALFFAVKDDSLGFMRVESRSDDGCLGVVLNPGKSLKLPMSASRMVRATFASKDGRYNVYPVLAVTADNENQAFVVYASTMQPWYVRARKINQKKW